MYRCCCSFLCRRRAFPSRRVALLTLKSTTEKWKVRAYRMPRKLILSAPPNRYRSDTYYVQNLQILMTVNRVNKSLSC